MAGQNRFATSFLVGLLALPLAAAGATALVASQSAPLEKTLPEPLETAALAAATATVPDVAAVTDPVAAVDENGSEADLARACGSAGLELVDRESRSELSDLEQAALDALRSICETEGKPLPGPPAPAPVIRTVAVDQVTPSNNVVAAMNTSRDSEDDHDEDELHEEDEEDEDDD